MRLYRNFLLLLFCFYVSKAAAQQNFAVTGTVRSADGKPLENITVWIETLEFTTVTNNEGRFVLRNIAAGNYVLSFSAVGYITGRKLISVSTASSIDMVLQPRIAGLKEVVVTARPRTVGSSSVIERSAIIHTQPTSLADVLQLVPGQLATNPNLGIAQQVNLRQVPSTTDAARANALGTQIVLDGVPLSNNANLQTNVTILNSGPSALPPFSSVAGRGNDLRQIPADNIESIEVVRGIPSSRFGDLTSGLIIVNSRIGAFRPEVRVRLNPNLAQAAIAAGIVSKDGRNTINLSGDIINAGEDVRDKFNRYTRAQAQVAWQKFWNESKTFSTTNIISGYKTLDALKQDPDDQRNQSKHYADEWGVKISSEDRWRSARSEGFSFLYTAALTYSHQQGYFQSLVTRDLFPIATATTDTTQVGVYGRSEYLNQTTVDGRPLNTYARVEGSWVKTALLLRHKLMLGAEWRMDVNSGEGRMFDVLTPPRQNYSVGERPRSYRSIPALHQLGYYLEDRISGNIVRRAFILQAGLRIDNTAPQGFFTSKYKTIVSPRLNLVLETMKGFWLRGGYGIAAKAPTLNYLYGGTRFFDLAGFNYFANNPAERLVVLTTRTVDLDNLDLAPYTSKKWEAGFDWNYRGSQTAVSFFHETTTGAIGFNREVKPFSYPVYSAQSFPPGQPPVLNPAPSSIDTFFAVYDMPVNNRYIQNRGVEYSIDLPEIKSLRTSFNITGAYIRTGSFDDGRFTDADKAYGNNQTPTRVGIYQSSARVVATRFNSSVRLIHRIPQLNMIVSGLWQTVWVSTSQQQTLSPYPVAFVNRRGEITDLGEAEAKTPAYGDLVRPVNEGFRTSYPPLHLYNIRLTREWKKGYSFSFFANNFLNHRPSSRVATSTTTTAFVRRNEPLFFGAEFSLSL
jgi:outer membrane receptor for ferrienterochelin and colicin